MITKREIEKIQAELYELEKRNDTLTDAEYDRMEELGEKLMMLEYKTRPPRAYNGNFRLPSRNIDGRLVGRIPSARIISYQ